MSPRTRRPGFIWVPPVRSTKWTVTIDDVDVSDEIISSTFTRGLVGEEMGCEIELDNSGDLYTDRFSFGHVIKVTLDFADGTTKQWEGELEEQQKKLDNNGFTLNIRGSHYTAKLLDVTVTGEFTDTEVSVILISIVGDFLTGFTTTNVDTTSSTVSIKWNNKPFLDCVLDLINLSEFDCYVDDDKDFHFFDRGSINNDSATLVDDDAIMELRGLGPDSVDVGNEIIVYGEADGLPVLATSPDSASQKSYGLKERVIKDTSITDEDRAKSIGDAELAVNKNPATKGSADILLTPSMRPGDMVYVIYPPQKVHDRFRIISYTYHLPDEIMDCNFSKETTIPKLFKERAKRELGQETITNPFKMKHSFNFTFDDESKIDSASSNNVEVDDGTLKLTSGTVGKMVSIKKDTPITVDKAHLIVKGDNISANTYRVSTDSGNSWTDINPEEETDVTDGDELKLEVNLNSADARLDAVALLYK